MPGKYHFAHISNAAGCAGSRKAIFVSHRPSWVFLESNKHKNKNRKYCCSFWSFGLWDVIFKEIWHQPKYKWKPWNIAFEKCAAKSCRCIDLEVIKVRVFHCQCCPVKSLVLSSHHGKSEQFFNFFFSLLDFCSPSVRNDLRSVSPYRWSVASSVVPFPVRKRPNSCFSLNSTHPARGNFGLRFIVESNALTRNIMGGVSRVCRSPVRWSKWSSLTADGCSTGNSCPRLDILWGNEENSWLAVTGHGIGQEYKLTFGWARKSGKIIPLQITIDRAQFWLELHRINEIRNISSRSWASHYVGSI